ncbi:nuclear transport factor 2 family protein [Nesterenkonia sp.]|uniref:nuclear transport factor 2 family protein n=1 Tax=Nesterenkonia sp. TaxID=704201 RepID=UPI00261CE61D|nr:nuclear transport factor 2 family protein [Nesterenkonia sp.]
MSALPETNTLTVAEMPADCGNAPRKIVIRDFLIALYDHDADSVLTHLDDAVEWHIIGDRVLHGHEEVAAWLATERAAAQLTIHSVITHGTDCGADGIVESATNSKLAFSHVLIFKGHSKTAPIKTLRSYSIHLPTE